MASALAHVRGAERPGLAHYHKRSNVESVFSAVKRKLGPSVRAKALPAQINEVLLKCLAYNLTVLVHAIQELRIDPAFLGAPGGPLAMPHRDLSLEQQENVRVCLRSLRARFGNWRNVERSLPVAHSVLVEIMSGRCEVSVAIAFRARRCWTRPSTT